MKLTGLVPILQCSSVERSLSFYKDTLGFVEIRSRKNNDQLEWVYLNSGKTYLMLELSNQPVKAKNDISLYFYTDDVDGLHQYLKAKQYAISELEITPYQLKQCRFTDPDGHKIQIGETISK